MRIRTEFEMTLRKLAIAMCALVLAATAFAPNVLADNASNRRVLVRDITSVEGVRDNMLVGYGLVAGLTQTGDSQQTYFTVQTLANAMQKMGVLIPSGTVEVRNVAAVFITASLPPFARPGEKIDVTVSSVGDAKSLAGGVLLMTALHGPDGQVYAEAQGPLTIGGYSGGNAQNGKQVNTPTVGTVPNGGIVERDTAVDLHGFKTVSLLLRNPDFTTAQRIADVINTHYPATAVAENPTIVTLHPPASQDMMGFVTAVEDLEVEPEAPAKVVIDEDAGVIVMGEDVRVSTVAIAQGNLTISVQESPSVSQPLPFSQGQTALVPHSSLSVDEAKGKKLLVIKEGASLASLVAGLNALGVTPRDMISILQAIKAAGALQADIEVM